jgi:CheY-like chemotaxis protein
MREPTTEMPGAEITGADASAWGCSAGGEILAGAETILLVEDEAFVRDVTCEVLRSAAYRVLAARNAADAVRMYEARPAEVELLLSDVVLPGETGPAMALRLRREHPELKVLFVTGYAEQMGLLEGKQEEFLAKPFSAEALLRKVRQVLDRRGLPTGEFAEKLVSTPRAHSSG